METETSLTHLFVYGTLRESKANPMHRLLYGTTLVGTGTLQGSLYDLGNYPAAIPSDDPGALVYGEVYLLHDPAATLALLDQYEACSPEDPTPHEYARVVTNIRLEDGSSLPAQTYLYDRPVDALTPVPSGDYLRWRSRLADPSTGA